MNSVMDRLVNEYNRLNTSSASASGDSQEPSPSGSSEPEGAKQNIFLDRINIYLPGSD